MNSERWQEIKNLFQSAMEVEPERRTEYVTELCNGDPQLQQEVESLLEVEKGSSRYFEKPAMLAAQAIHEVAGYVDSMIGRPLGPYRIERLLGHGGMGTVYFATRSDEGDHPVVAIKMVSRGLDTATVIRRFQKEQQILANLDHANIARLFDGGTTEHGLPYFVMEYVEGQPIDVYAEGRRLSTIERLQLFLRVCAAVDAAHQKGVVHRDIKPSNILVTAAGQPKLLDFGIAKIVDPGVFDADAGTTLTGMTRIMTPDYASPEQVLGKPVTPATDVYALGILLYELLTGQRPYRLQSRSAEEITRVVCNQEPRKPSTHRSLPGALDDITLKALRKEPGQRYLTVAALAADIQAHLEGRPISASRGALRYRARRYFTGHRRAIGLVSCLVIVVAAMAFALRWRGTAIERQDSGRSSAAQTTAIKARPSIAVLGFKNLSKRTEEAWLATALAEMFTTELAAGGQVRTIRVENVFRLKLELAVNDDQTLSQQTVSQIHKDLGADFLVDGAYLILDRNTQIRLDLRVSNAQQEVVLALSETGPESDIFTIVSKAGSRLREQLGLSATQPNDVKVARAVFPQNPEGIRLYTEGLDKLRVFDATTALPLLQRAAELDPQRPLTYSAIAEAWSRLGYDGKAADAAKKAYELTAGYGRGERLSEERLSIEARYRESQEDWEKAIDVYGTLWSYFPDDVEYGLRLSAVQVAAGKGKEALATVAAMRQLPAPSSGDPRIDVAEGDALGVLSDFKRQQQAYAGAAKKARASGAKLLLATARLNEGRTFYTLAQPDKAIEALQEAQALFTAAGDRAGIASTLNRLAQVYHDLTDITHGVEIFQQSLAISREIGDRRQTATALTSLGTILKDQNRFAEARTMHEQALALRMEIGNKAGTASALNNIGIVFEKQGEFAEAAKRYQESLRVCRDIGDRRGIVRALHNLSIVNTQLGELAEARKGFEESLAIRREIFDRRGLVIGLSSLADVLIQQGDLAAAKKNIDESLAAAREMKFKSAEADALSSLADIALVEGDPLAARRHQEAAVALAKEMHDEQDLVASRLALAGVALEQGRPGEAEAIATELENSLPTPGARAEAELLQARALLDQNKIDSAAAALNRAKSLAGGTQKHDLRAMITITQSRLDIARQQSSAALQNLGSLYATLIKNGDVLLQFETRLVQCEARLQSNQTPAAKTCSAALQTDSEKLGFKRVAEKARKLVR